MSASPSRFNISYGSVDFGSESATRRIHQRDGPFSLEWTWEGFSLEFSFVTSADTESSFATEKAAVVSALRKPYQNIKVTSHAADEVDLSHTLATGFNATATLLKNGNADLDTHLTRNYRVRINAELPANLLGTGDGREGLREASVDLSETPAGRRTMSVSGVYTAVPGAGGNVHARAQYEAKIGDYVKAIIANLGGVWESMDTSSAAADESDFSTGNIGMGKSLRFSRSYKEIIFEQGPSPDLPTGGGTKLDDSKIKDQTLAISRRRTAPGDTREEGGSRFVEFSATYDCHIITTDTDLKARWAELRPWVFDEVKKSVEDYVAGPLAILDLSVTLNPDDNRISANMHLVGYGGSGTGFVERRRTTETTEASGKVLVPIWSGDPLARYVYQGPGSSMTTVTDTVRSVGKAGAAPRPDPPEIPEAAILVSTRTQETPLRMGFGDVGDELDVLDMTLTTTFERYVPVDNTGKADAGGGRRTTVDPEAPALGQSKASRRIQAKWAAQGLRPQGGPVQPQRGAGG